MSTDSSVDEHHIKLLEYEKLKAEKHIHYLRSERDRIISFWNITKQQLYKAQQDILKSSVTEERLRTTHCQHIQAYRQRLRHVLIQHEIQIQKLNDDAASNLQSAQQASAAAAATKEQQHRAELAIAQQAVQDAQLEAAAAKIKCEERIMTETKRFEDLIISVQTDYERKWSEKQLAMQDMFQSELRAAQDSMQATVTQLKQQQQETLKQLQESYQTQLQVQTQTAEQLKEENERLVEREAAAQRQAKSIREEFAGLKDSLQTAQEELSSAQKQVSVLKTETFILESTKKRLAALEKDKRQLLLENEELRLCLESKVPTDGQITITSNTGSKKSTPTVSSLGN